MIKRIVPCLLLLAFCASVSLASIITDDGYLTAGEYEYFVEWRSYEPPLIVDGGGGGFLK